MKYRRGPTTCLLALTACLLTGWPAWGDDTGRRGLYIGLSGTAAISLFEDPLEALVSSNPELGDSAGFQIRMGYRLLSWLALEAQYEWLNEFALSQTSNETYESRIIAEFTPQTVTANVKLILPTGRIEPHLIIGVGVSVWDGRLVGSDTSKSDSAFAARLGAGVDFHLSSSWILQASGTGVLGTAQFIPENGDIPFPIEDLYYFSFGAGLLYRF